MKIGYAGRLDPLAHGVLLLMIGEETKQRETYQNFSKTYEFEAMLGLGTDSYDLLGIVDDIKTAKQKTDTDKQIQQFIESKLGTHRQPYPPFSSKAVRGKPLHWWAKQHRLSEITIPDREITIYSFELLSTDMISIKDLKKRIQTSVSNVQGYFRQREIHEHWEQYFRELSIHNPQIAMFNTARFRVSCSSGTYVRGLVHELGEFLGTGAVTTEILRTQVGEYTIEDSLKLH